ncbi:MAG: LexA family protein, partial [Candidatus Syntropharchaeia archaeon]
SLKEENVMKGDYLVIKRQREAENGDIVIVVREGTDLEVLKYTDGGNIGKLVKTGDIRIVGKAIGLIRLFR